VEEEAWFSAGADVLPVMTKEIIDERYIALRAMGLPVSGSGFEG